MQSGGWIHEGPGLLAAAAQGAGVAWAGCRRGRCVVMVSTPSRVQSRSTARRLALRTRKYRAFLRTTRRIEREPYTFFRRVNRSWNERVCAAFAAERLRNVRLHGDAHVEQSASLQDRTGSTTSTIRRKGRQSSISCASSAHCGSRRSTRWQAQIDGHRRVSLRIPSRDRQPRGTLPRTARRSASAGETATDARRLSGSTGALMEPAPAAVISVALARRSSSSRNATRVARPATSRSRRWERCRWASGVIPPRSS